jgi:hypothetical protein
MPPIKAVLFGKVPPGVLPGLSPLRLHRRSATGAGAFGAGLDTAPQLTLCADLDDTLVITEDADKAALKRVAELAEDLLPGVSGAQVVNDWRPLFHASPWCPEGKVGRPGRCKASQAAPLLAHHTRHARASAPLADRRQGSRMPRLLCPARLGHPLATANRAQSGFPASSSWQGRVYETQNASCSCAPA